MTFWFKFLQKGSLYPHTLMYIHGTWTQWSLGKVTHVTSTNVGSKVIFLAWTVFSKRLCDHYLRSMYVVICKIDHCIHIHWCIPMGLGHNDPWVESHMWPQQIRGQRTSRVNDLWLKYLQKGSLYPHTLMYFHGTWTQWSLGRVMHVTSTDVGSKVI